MLVLVLVLVSQMSEWALIRSLTLDTWCHGMPHAACVCGRGDMHKRCAATGEWASFEPPQQQGRSTAPCSQDRGHGGWCPVPPPPPAPGACMAHPRQAFASRLLDTTPGDTHCQQAAPRPRVPRKTHARAPSRPATRQSSGHRGRGYRAPFPRARGACRHCGAVRDACRRLRVGGWILSGFPLGLGKVQVFPRQGCQLLWVGGGVGACWPWAEAQCDTRGCCHGVQNCFGLQFSRSHKGR